MPKVVTECLPPPHPLAFLPQPSYTDNGSEESQLPHCAELYEEAHVVKILTANSMSHHECESPAHSSSQKMGTQANIMITTSWHTLGQKRLAPGFFTFRNV